MRRPEGRKMIRSTLRARSRCDAELLAQAMASIGSASTARRQTAILYGAHHSAYRPGRAHLANTPTAPAEDVERFRGPRFCLLARASAALPILPASDGARRHGRRSAAGRLKRALLWRDYFRRDAVDAIRARAGGARASRFSLPPRCRAHHRVAARRF